MTGSDPVALSLEGVRLLWQLDLESFVSLFWYTILLDFPRYGVGGLVILLAPLVRRLSDKRDETPAGEPAPALAVSVVIAGHNEGQALPRCIAAIREQTLFAEPGRVQVVVVDDGSSDDTARVMAELRGAGTIDVALSLGLRGGKSAAINLGLHHCTGDIVIIADVDTSFDRDAFERLLEPFADPTVGAVSGNLGLHNPFASLVTRFQAIEYLISISLGRRVSDILGVLSIVSGAFGAFRRAALDSVGGYDVEVGEDADLTLKFIWASWRVRFAPEARARTDAPETLSALIRQRLRWDRCIISIWGRKYRRLFDPRHANFSLLQALILADVFFFGVTLSLALIVYLFWLFLSFGAFGFVLLMASLSLYVALALVMLSAAALIEREEAGLSLLVYVPFYSLMSFTVMRLVRLAAFTDELVFRRSYRDPYVPRRVMDQVEWL